MALPSDKTPRLATCRPIEPLPREWLTREVRQQLDVVRRFDGYVQPGATPRLFFKGGISEPFFFVDRVCGDFGGLLSVVALSPEHVHSRLCIWSDMEATLSASRSSTSPPRAAKTRA